MARGGGKINSDWLEIDYQRADAISADNLAYDATTSIKAAILQGGGSIGGIREVEYFTLDANNISFKYVTLSHYPINDEIQFVIIEGTTQIYGVDFIRKELTKISWSSTDTTVGLEGQLEAGDIIQIEYSHN